MIDLALGVVVVVGLSTIDGTSTDVVRVAATGERELAFTLDHARGRLPKGALDAARDRLVTVSVVDDATATVLEETQFASGARRVLATGAIATQAPRVDADTGAVMFVRETGQTARGLEVVRMTFDGALDVLHRDTSSTWIGIATAQAPPAIVRLDAASSAFQLRELPGRTIELGKGRMRAPAIALRGKERVVVVERATATPNGEILVSGLKGDRDLVIHAGIGGMDPIALPDGRVVFGAGTKDGRVIVTDALGKDRFALETGRAGVATPKAATIVDGEPVVVAWLDRGASLPGELWLLSTTGAARLIDPAAHVAVEVYGITTVTQMTGSAK